MSKEVWMWLAEGMGFGAVNTGELLHSYPQGALAVLGDLGGESLDEILTQKQAEKLASTRPADFALPLAYAEAQGIHALPYDDRLYPDMLRSISNPPLMLFVKGDVSLLNGQLCVGMVGARRPSGYGVEAVRTLGRGVALGGAIIVSGLAAGLDSEAHKAALAVNGPTIACIAFGHENCYPAQNKKLMEVIERYGAVLSEYPPAQKPEKPFFLHRNRLIAGLSHALVVAEARKHSGTMSTVNFATDYGRDVFAVPGSIFSELSAGTNAMVRDGAYLAATAGDILSMYGIELPEEDLAKAAAAQAQEGRPAMAVAGRAALLGEERPSPARQMERQDFLPDKVSPPEVKNSEQTLLEALQGQLGQGGAADRVSRGAAIDAFRRLQQEIPPTDDAELDARNRALDEMVAAVSDDVDIRRPPAGKPTGERSERRREWEKQLEDKPKKKDKVKPFRWDSVEHLTKEEVAQKEEEARKRSQRPRPQAVRPSYPSRGLGPIAPLTAVEPLMAPRPAMPMAPMAVPMQPGAQPQAPRSAGAQGAAAERGGKVVIPEIETRPRAGRGQAPVARSAPAEMPPKKQAAQPTPPPPQAQTAPPQAAQQQRGGEARQRRERAEPPPVKPAAPKAEGRSLLDAFRREDDSLSGKLRTLQKHPETGRASTLNHEAQQQGEAGVYRPPGHAAQGLSITVPPPPEAAPEREGRPLPPPLPAEPPAMATPPDLESLLLVAAEQERAQSSGVQMGAQFAFPPPELAEGEVLETLSEAAKLAFDQLGVKPVSLADIAHRSGLSPGQAMAALTELELAELSRQLPGRQFIIMQ